MMRNKMTDLATANATEEEKLKVMMSQSSEGFDPSKYPTKPAINKQATSSHIRLPPPNYVCFRCGQRGHWLRFCPTQGDSRYDNLAVKPLAGVPASQLVTLDHYVPGAMVDRHGNYVMRSVDYEAMLKRSKSSAPMREAIPVPDELKCSMCSELMKDAVIIQCCGESFCDECIREYLLENDFTCPKCSETDVSPDTLMANKALRTAVKNHQNVNSIDQRAVSQKVFKDVTMLTTATTVEQADEKKYSVTMATTASLPNITMVTTVAPSSVTMATATVEHSTPLCSQAVKNHQNVNSIDQRDVSKKVLNDVTMLTTATTVEQADEEQCSVTVTTTASLPNITMVTTVAPSSVTMATASNKKTPPENQSQPTVTIQSEVITQQVATTTTTQPTVAQPTATVASMTYSSATPYKPALLPTPAAMATPVAAATTSQLDPYTVAAAAALLLASGTSSTGPASTAPDPASLLAADQLLQKELNNRSRSPAPLSAEEFYRQQNRLKSKNKRKHSSSTNSSPTRTHKRKHRHGNKERKKHKSREEKSTHHKHKRKKHHMDDKSTTNVTNTVTPPTSSESLDDGIEEGEILEASNTHTPASSVESNDPPVKDYKVRKLKRKSSKSIEPPNEQQQLSSHKLKKRKWKKDKDISGEKCKKHKIK